MRLTLAHFKCDFKEAIRHLSSSPAPVLKLRDVFLSLMFSGDLQRQHMFVLQPQKTIMQCGNMLEADAPGSFSVTLTFNLLLFGSLFTL